MIILPVAGTAVVLGAVSSVVVPKLILRNDERRANPATGLDQPIPDLKETTITTDDGAELHVVERGEGPPLVLVHGLALDHRTWHYQYLDLANRFRVIGVDLRGHGTSTLGADPVGPRRFAADLAEVIEQLDLRDAVVVGHSLGGSVLGQLCADFPGVVRARVSKIVFVDTFASAIAGEGRFRELVSPTLVRVVAKLRPARKPKKKPATSSWMYVMARYPFGPSPQPEQVRLTMLMGAAAEPAVVPQASVANLAYDVRKDLASFDGPALVVRGSDDKLATARSAHQLERALARPEMVLVEDCGHLPMLENRDHFGSVLADFASRV